MYSMQKCFAMALFTLTGFFALILPLKGKSGLKVGCQFILCKTSGLQYISAKFPKTIKMSLSPSWYTKALPDCKTHLHLHTHETSNGHYPYAAHNNTLWAFCLLLCAWSAIGFHCLLMELHSCIPLAFTFIFGSITLLYTASNDPYPYLNAFSPLQPCTIHTLHDSSHLWPLTPTCHTILLLTLDFSQIEICQ